MPDWSFGEEKYLLSLSGIESPFLGSLVRSLVTIMTELPQLPRVVEVPASHLEVYLTSAGAQILGQYLKLGKYCFFPHAF